MGECATLYMYAALLYEEFPHVSPVISHSYCRKLPVPSLRE